MTIQRPLKLRVRLRTTSTPRVGGDARASPVPRRDTRNRGCQGSLGRWNRLAAGLLRAQSVAHWQSRESRSPRWAQSGRRRSFAGCQSASRRGSRAVSSRPGTGPETEEENSSGHWVHHLRFRGGGVHPRGCEPPEGFCGPKRFAVGQERSFGPSSLRTELSDREPAATASRR